MIPRSCFKGDFYFNHHLIVRIWRSGLESLLSISLPAQNKKGNFRLIQMTTK